MALGAAGHLLVKSSVSGCLSQTVELFSASNICEELWTETKEGFYCFAEQEGGCQRWPVGSVCPLVVVHQCVIRAGVFPFNRPLVKINKQRK